MKKTNYFGKIFMFDFIILMGLERLHFHLKALPNVLTSTYTTTPYIFRETVLCSAKKKWR